MMRRYESVIGPIVLLLSLGCVTRYAPMGFGGGYTDSQIDSNTFRVSVHGNRYTDSETIQDYLMYRCAELTKESGFDYFVMLSSGDKASQRQVTLPGHYVGTTTGQATAYGNTAYGTATTTGTYFSGPTVNVTRYSGTAIIKVFKGQKPADNPGAFDAGQVMYFLSEVVGRPVAVAGKP